MKKKAKKQLARAGDEKWKSSKELSFLHLGESSEPAESSQEQKERCWTHYAPSSFCESVCLVLLLLLGDKICSKAKRLSQIIHFDTWNISFVLYFGLCGERVKSMEIRHMPR